MTRETKIGLLVGLAFIVLFGFLLSGVGRDGKPTVVPTDKQPIVPQGSQQGPSAGTIQRPRFAVDSVLDRLGRSTAQRKTAKQPERPVGVAAVGASAGNGSPSLRTSPVSPVARSIDPSRDWCERKEIDLSSLRSAAETAAVVPGAAAHTTATGSEKAAAAEQAGTAASRPRIYVVQPLDTLTDIAKKVYGEAFGSQWRRIFQANRDRLGDPDILRVGQQLVIPPLSPQDLARGQPKGARFVEVPAGPVVLGAADRTSQRYRIYVVRSGDVLSRIAQSQLGSSRRWREIYLLNRDQLDDPDEIKVGMRLKLPPTE